MKKYELSNPIYFGTRTLYRVIYTDEFIAAFKEKRGFTINKKGGLIEGKHNLSEFEDGNDFAVVEKF